MHQKSKVERLFLLSMGVYFVLSGMTGLAWAQTSEPSQLKSADWYINPLFTVGESIGDYTPPGILDGIGATQLDGSTVRVYVNHELTQGVGYPYALANGTELTGARVSYFDIDAATREILTSNLAYDTIIDRAGNEVAVGTQIDPGNAGTEGLRRLCSSGLFNMGEFGLEDTIYFTGEETGGGQEFALDTENGILYAIPWMGRAAWENITMIDTGDEATIGILVGDDREGAPLLLYIGEKGAVGDGSFLDRNGLAQGKLYAWVADTGDLSPEDWNGTGTSRNGSFVEIEIYDASMAGTDGYDAEGFVNQEKQDELVAAAGAFQFSRPEDVATNPEDGTQVVFASTGRGGAYPSDDWGTTYLIDVDMASMSAELTIWYDGDDAGAGQFSDPDEGLRSPDNLDWADDGMIYIQEDRSTRNAVFGGVSGEEASIWKLDPSNGELTRIAQVDRNATPSGQTDGDPDDLGDWETSGILDVTSLFDTEEGEVLLIGDVQAHSVRDGVIESEGLVQGGQLFLMSAYPVIANTPFKTTEQSQLGSEDWKVDPVFTVGEAIDGYTPPGILDGIGATQLGGGLVRVYVNHELTQGVGYPYLLANGTALTGARVSYFDFEASSRQILASGLAYHTIIDRAGEELFVGTQIDPGNGGTEGLRRLCSSGLFNMGEFGLEDTIYFTGEETGGGQEFALDTENGILYAIPWMGRAAWENITMIDTGDEATIGILVGDDREGAPLLLYIGEKGAVGDGSFLDRNGLAQGKLYAWVADTGDLSPEDWNGTGTSRNGSFVEIEIYDASMAGTDGYDAEGFVNQEKQDELVAAAGAFQFSRPEDVATNPEDGTQVVFASTGRGGAYPSDDWGTTYLIDVDMASMSAELTIWYDGDDAGAGQFSDPDEGLRSPDNLDWADDGMIYIQEDRSTRNAVFGGVSGEEASIWKLDPSNGELTRIAQVDRNTQLPEGQTDGDPDDLGDWETSGILDVTSLFDTEEGEVLLIGDVQAHSVRDGVIESKGLVQGGQLFFMSASPMRDGSVFTLVNSQRNVEIAAYDPIPNGAELVIEELPRFVNVVAHFDGDVEKVEFELNGQLVQTELVAPYTLFGDRRGNYVNGMLPIGDHVLVATPYYDGVAGESESVSFSVVSTDPLKVTSLVVVDASSGAELFELTNGASIDAESLPDAVNVVAKTGFDVKSVLFDLNDGVYTRLENVVPYALFGDVRGNYLRGTLPVGEHKLTATPYAQNRARGAAGNELTVSFSVTGSASKAGSLPSGHSEEPVDGLMSDIPQDYALDGNYPNPFNPVTTIAFSLPQNTQVQLLIFDVLGRQVATVVDGALAAGVHEVHFDASNLPGGTYFYSLEAGEHKFVKSMVLLK